MRVWGATWMGLLSAVTPSWASACPGCAQVGVADAGRTLSVLGALAALPVAAGRGVLRPLPTHSSPRQRRHGRGLRGRAPAHAATSRAEAPARREPREPHQRRAVLPRGHGLRGHRQRPCGADHRLRRRPQHGHPLSGDGALAGRRPRAVHPTAVGRGRGHPAEHGHRAAEAGRERARQGPRAGHRAPRPQAREPLRHVPRRRAPAGEDPRFRHRGAPPPRGEPPRPGARGHAALHGRGADHPRRAHLAAHRRHRAGPHRLRDARGRGVLAGPQRGGDLRPRARRVDARGAVDPREAPRGEPPGGLRRVDAPLPRPRPLAAPPPPAPTRP
jgi:hypothetical protein